MKEQGTHEGCIEQEYRLFHDRLYAPGAPVVDENGYIRLDDWEMAPDTQAAIAKLWSQVTTENISQLADLAGYQSDFYRLFGFGVPGIDYNAECDPEVEIPSLKETV